MIKHITKLTPQSKVLLGVLGALMAITSLSTDIYLPAMPQMQLDLGGDVELTVTGFLIGFAIGQLIWGPISDKKGRLLPLVLGLILFIIGSVGCALSQSIGEILIWRVVQAFGACTGPMLSRAMVRDMHGSTKAAEMLSTLMIIMALAPIVGPLLGGQILKLSSWHSIFWLLSIIGVLMVIALAWLPETYPHSRRPDTSFSKAFTNYKLLLKHRKFMMYTLCVTFYYVAVYAFITGSPNVYIKYFDIKPQYYGFLFGLNILGVMMFSIVNRQLVRRYNLHSILQVATGVATLGGMVLISLQPFHLGIVAVVIPVFTFFSMNGIVAATSTAAALSDVPEMAGAASALLGSLQYGSGILSSILLAVFSDGTPQTMCLVMAVFSLLSLLMVIVRPGKQNKQRIRTSI